MNTAPEQAQLDRIEGMQVEQSSLLRQLWARVDNLEKRASFWGAVSAALVMLVTKLAGCI
jgi:hypothetical protein